MGGVNPALPLHEILWQRNREVAEACRRHPFVRALADESLDREAFKRYIAQDAFFLEAFARAYALAAAKSPDGESLAVFGELFQAVRRELGLHARYAESLGIDLKTVPPYPATKAYTDFLLAAAWHRPLDVMVAAMTPCMRLYAYLGRELAREVPEPSRASHPYRDWIETYSASDFQSSTAQLESLLDRLARDRPEVQEAYRYALECELRFFSSPLERNA